VIKKYQKYIMNNRFWIGVDSQAIAIQSITSRSQKEMSRKLINA